MQPIYYTIPSFWRNSLLVAVNSCVHIEVAIVTMYESYWWNSLLVAINSCVRVEMAIITMYEKLLVEFLARGD